MITLLLALATAQQAPSTPIQRAAQAFGTCVEGKLPQVPATMTPEAGADDVLKQCDTQRAALQDAIEGMLTGAPPTQQAMARGRFKEGMERGRQGMIDGIKAMRAGKAQ